MSTQNDPSIPFTKMSARDKYLRDLFDRLLVAFNPNTICDVGAFNGDETFRFAATMPNADIFAFEASDLNFNQFWHENPRLKQYPKVTITQNAVTDYTGTVDFNVLDAENHAGDWRRAANSLVPRVDGLKSRTITVPCTTLDDFFGTRSINDRTFMMWIDVEGALDRVIGGSRHVLERTIGMRVEVEWKELWANQKLAGDVKAQLEAHGFFVVGDTFIPNGYDQSDVLLLRKDVLNLLSP
jgi:FkbM family methyltransferase